MKRNAIFIAATGQNVGKTTLCLGIMAALKKRFGDVGFIKPVGQQHVEVEPGLRVDKDAVLFKEYFDLNQPYELMSPVLIPAGLTRAYLDGKVDTRGYRTKIKAAFKTILKQSSFTLVEGTGHVGVGSIVDLNNARIARRLNLDTVIIASGGLGSSFDSLAMNIEMMMRHKVRVRGVILNRVRDDKRDMILEYFPKALKQYGIPLIGCMPFSQLLNTPTMGDFESLFDTPMLSGGDYRYRHYRTTRLVSGSLESYLEEDAEALGQKKELIITPASRDDIIFTILTQHQNKQVHPKVGLMLTGRKPPHEKTVEAIRNSRLPSLYVPMCSYDAMKQITTFIGKIRREDSHKVEKAIDLVENHIDLDHLCGKKLPPVTVPAS